MISKEFDMAAWEIMREAMTQVLGKLMSQYCEEHRAAGWYSGAEEIIPARILAYGDDASMDELEMAILADIIGHWAVWDGAANEYKAYIPKGNDVHVD